MTAISIPRRDDIPFFELPYRRDEVALDWYGFEPELWAYGRDVSGDLIRGESHYRYVDLPPGADPADYVVPQFIFSNHASPTLELELCKPYGEGGYNHYLVERGPIVATAPLAELSDGVYGFRMVHDGVEHLMIVGEFSEFYRSGSADRVGWGPLSMFGIPLVPGEHSQVVAGLGHIKLARAGFPAEGGFVASVDWPKGASEPVIAVGRTQTARRDPRLRFF